MTPTRVRKRSVGVPGTAQGKTSTTEDFTPTHQQKEQFAGGQWGVRRWVYEHIWRASLVNPYHSLKHSRSVSFKNNTTTTTTDPFIPCYSPATPPLCCFKLSEKLFIFTVYFLSSTYSSVQSDLAPTLNTFAKTMFIKITNGSFWQFQLTFFIFLSSLAFHEHWVLF